MSFSEHCLELVQSGESLQALTALGQRAQILLSKVGQCYDEKKNGWDPERIQSLEKHLEENRVLIRMAHSEAFRDGGEKKWIPIKGEKFSKTFVLKGPMVN